MESDPWADNATATRLAAQLEASSIDHGQAGEGEQGNSDKREVEEVDLEEVPSEVADEGDLQDASLEEVPVEKIKAEETVKEQQINSKSSITKLEAETQTSSADAPTLDQNENTTKQELPREKASSSKENKEDGEIDTGPSPMAAAPKTPTKKALEKSLKRSKAAPALLPTVISKTRQRDLPPKPREEDNKHLQEYNDMILQARVLDKKRAEVEATRRQTRDSLAAAHLPLWESEVVPNWKKVRQDEKLRKIWWSGTMPARFRANLWSACIGNSLMIGKSSFQKSLALAKNLIATGRMPESIPQMIDEDVAITLPQTKLFQKSGGPLSQDLQDLLLAYSVFWKDTPSYSRGVSFIAAMLLVSMPINSAFIALVNIINNSFLHYFYEHNQDYMDAYDRVFSTLLADHMPAISHNFIANNIRPSLYLHPWLTTAYAYFLPLDCATRVFDIFVLEGDSFLFRFALALLEAMEARLFNPDQDELAALFQAKDKGAKALVARDKVAKFGGNLNDVDVWPEEVYAQCGATEQDVFDALEVITWRENSWDRILTRELPD